MKEVQLINAALGVLLEFGISMQKVAQLQQQRPDGKLTEEDVKSLIDSAQSDIDNINV